MMMIGISPLQQHYNAFFLILKFHFPGYDGYYECRF